MHIICAVQQAWLKLSPMWESRNDDRSATRPSRFTGRQRSELNRTDSRRLRGWPTPGRPLCLRSRASGITDCLSQQDHDPLPRRVARRCPRRESTGGQPAITARSSFRTCIWGQGPARRNCSAIFLPAIPAKPCFWWAISWTAGASEADGSGLRRTTGSLRRSSTRSTPARA